MFGKEIEYLPARPGEARETLADISKTINMAGWVPSKKLEDYVKEWLKENE